MRLLRLRLAVAVHTARAGVQQEATDAERHAAASSPPKLMARGTFQHTARRCTAARGCAAVRRSCLALHGRRCQVGHSESPAATPRATSAARQALRRSSGVLKASDFSGAPTRYAPASPAMIRGGALPSAVQRAAKLGFAAVSGLVTGQGRRAPFGHNATFCQSLGTHSKGAPQAAPCAQLLSPAVSAERQVHASSSPGEQLRVISRGGAYGGPARGGGARQASLSALALARVRQNPPRRRRLLQLVLHSTILLHRACGHQTTRDKSEHQKNATDQNTYRKCGTQVIGKLCAHLFCERIRCSC